MFTNLFTKKSATRIINHGKGPVQEERYSLTHLDMKFGGILPTFDMSGQVGTSRCFTSSGFMFSKPLGVPLPSHHTPCWFFLPPSLKEQFRSCFQPSHCLMWKPGRCFESLSAEKLSIVYQNVLSALLQRMLFLTACCLRTAIVLRRNCSPTECWCHIPELCERIYYLSHKKHNLKRVLKIKVGPKKDRQRQLCAQCAPLHRELRAFLRHGFAWNCPLSGP